MTMRNVLSLAFGKDVVLRRYVWLQVMYVYIWLIKLILIYDSNTSI